MAIDKPHGEEKYYEAHIAGARARGVLKQAPTWETAITSFRCQSSSGQPPGCPDGWVYKSRLEIGCIAPRGEGPEWLPEESLRSKQEYDSEYE